MAAATPTLEEAIAAVAAAMEDIAGIGTVKTGFHTLEDDVEFLVAGGYLDSPTMDLWFVDAEPGAEEIEGQAVGEIYERYNVEIRYWSIRTADADWSKKARTKAESVRDALSANPDVFRIDGQVPLITPETVRLVTHRQETIRGTESEQLVYLSILAMQIEARRWGDPPAAAEECTPESASCIIANQVFGTGANVFGAH